MILPLRVKNVSQIGVEGSVSDCAFGVNRLWIQPPLDQSDVTRDLWTAFTSLAVSHSSRSVYPDATNIEAGHSVWPATGPAPAAGAAAGRYFIILQFGNACFSSATPASVIWGQDERLSSCRLIILLRFTSPASLIFLLPRRSPDVVVVSSVIAPWAIRDPDLIP